MNFGKKKFKNKESYFSRESMYILNKDLSPALKKKKIIIY